MVIIDYSTIGGKNVILEYIKKLPEGQKATAYRIRDKIRIDGIEGIISCNTRQLRGKLYEIKFSNQRIIYLIKDSDTVYFLHMCRKQKGKAAKKDLHVAMTRAKELGYHF